MSDTQLESKAGPKVGLAKKIGLALLAGLALIVIGASIGGGSEQPAASGDTSDTFTPPAATPTPAKPKAPEFTTVPSDWLVALTITDKQCFGSAGCNLTAEPKVTYAGSLTALPKAGVVTVTFSISGDEDGERIETVDLDMSDEGSYSIDRFYLGTRSSGVVPTATVTGAVYRNY